MKRLLIVIEETLLFISLFAGLVGCQKTDSSFVEEYTYTGIVMDTVLSEKIYSSNDYCKDLEEKLRGLEEQFLSWRVEGSEIAQMNTAFESGKSFDMTEEMTAWTESALEMARNSKGAFDPTIGKLARLWNIEGEHPVVPGQEEIKSCLKQTGYDKIHIKGNTIYIEETASLDLGAAGKGIACDKAYEYLKDRKDVKGATISVGGSVLAYGHKPDGSGWNIAIQNPEAESGVPMGVLNIEGTAFISTSGDYEKYFEQDGTKYHHILDPNTGYPSASDLSSVTIIAKEGILSDALSTACYVLGTDDSEELLNKYDATAIFIDHDHKITVVGPQKDSFKILDETFFVSK